MGKISNLSSYGFNEQPQFDGFINSLKEKADTTEIAEQVKKQESDIKTSMTLTRNKTSKYSGLTLISNKAETHSRLRKVGKTWP